MADVFVEIRQVVLTSLLSLVVMFVFTRIGGKRQIAQMSPFDYLNAVTVGSIGAELATNLEQWWRPLSALIIYILATWLVHYTACKSNAMRSFWSGRSLILMDGGVISKTALQRAAIDVNEFLGQARIAGYFDPNEIETAILETSGQISFLPKSLNRPLTPEEDEDVVRMINEAKPDFVWVGLGAPKQERWMAVHEDRVQALMVGVGAAFDYEAGNIRRAPQWMQKHNLEWLYRLMQDPKRLFKRYFVTNTKYLWWTWRQ